MMQYQYSATLFPPEATISPTSILPRLPSIDDLPYKVDIDGESAHTELHSVNVKNIGTSATLQSTFAPQATALYVPNLVNQVHVPIEFAPIM